MRLFSALPLSPEAIERLTRVRLRLSAPDDGLRWSAPEQWHITLQFYGDVEPARAECLGNVFERGAAGSPEIVLDGLGRFAAKGILFASVAITPSLQEFQRNVTELGRSCGFVPESRPFRPHITLARSKGPRGLATLQRLASPELPPFGPEIRWRAHELLLVWSSLRPTGAEYAVASRTVLARPAADPHGVG